MVSFVELRDCEPAAFGLSGQRWQQLAGQVANRSNEVDKHLAALAEWEGTAAEAAKAALSEERRKLHDSADQLGKIGSTLRDFCQYLGDNRKKLQQALDAARNYLLEVHPDGTVSAGGPAALLEGTDSTLRAEFLTDVISDLVRTATEADERAADALRKLFAQATGFAPDSNDPAVISQSQRIPSKASPADVRKWWDSLSPADRESLLFSHSAEIGGLDGIPAAVRDRVNRSLLLEQKDKLLEERSRLMAQGGNDDLRARIDEINSKLGGIDAIEKHLATAPGAAQQQYLLKINNDGNGRAIVAVGDPDTASNVATFVPGTGSSLAGCGDYLDRAELMARASARADPSSTSVVITWIGYDAPQDIIPDAMSERYALDAEKDLQRFQDGLRATHDGPSAHNTVIGYSYGTTTVGYAARDGSLNANDIVFVASPGVGVQHAQGLHLTGVDPSQNGSHIHSTTAEHDLIKLADGHFGPNPSDPGFGGQTFSSKPGDAGPWFGLSTKAHSQYWDSDNPALDNMGRVIAGKSTY